MATAEALPDDNTADGSDQLADPAPLAQSVRRGALWSIASSVTLRFASIAVTAVVAHILSRSDFGIFTVALTALWIVTSVGELGVASCLIRADLDIDALAPTMVTVSLVSCILLAGILLEWAVPIATALGSAAAAPSIRVMAIAAILGGVFAVPNAQLQRDFKQDKLFLSSAVSFVFSTALLLVLAKSGSGAMAFAWSRVLGQAVAGLVLVFSVDKQYRPGLSRTALSMLVRFGFPLGGSNFVSYILLNVDYAFVGHLMGAAALGTYVLAFNVASWPVSLFGAMITGVSMPAFSRVKAELQRLRAAVTSSMRALGLVVMPMSALTIATARPLVLTIYGAKWVESAAVLEVLSLYGCISIFCLLIANIISGLGRSKFLLVVQLVWLAALVPAMALGVRREGIVGAAYAHIAVIGPLILPSYLFVLHRLTGTRLRSVLGAILPALLPSIAAAAAAVEVTRLLTVPIVQLAAGLACGGAIYAIATAPMLVGLLSPEAAKRLRLDQIERLYRATGRALGLPITGGKHTVGYGAAYLNRVNVEMSPAGATTDQFVRPAELSQLEQTLQLRATELRALLESGRPGTPHSARHARADTRTRPGPLAPNRWE
jgi:lipopolysaccharide exporter